MKHRNQYLTYKERAKLYDIEYTDSFDQPFLRYFIEKANDILEVPCGTGRNINLYNGKRVCFIDLEVEMIEKIKTKSLNRMHLFSFFCDDICDFKINNKFDLIIIPREAFQLLIDPKRAEKALQNLCFHLKKSGKIVIDLYRFGSPDYNNQAPTYYHHKINERRYVLNWSRESDGLVIKRFSMYELVGDILKVVYKYEFHQEKRIIKYAQLHLKNYEYSDFLELVTHSGLRVQQVFGDYNFSNYTEKDNRMILILKKVNNYAN